MTHRWTVFGILMVAALSTLLMLRVASAETTPPELSQQKIQSIRSHCGSIRSTLNQLHTTDALLRVNRGQMYTSLSTNVMAKMNSRLALNRLDGSELVRVTTEYEEHYSVFRERYERYNDRMEELKKIDCTQNPEQFYVALTDARTLRTEVNEATKQLNRDIDAYHGAFSDFRTDFLSEQKAKND